MIASIKKAAFLSAIAMSLVGCALFETPHANLTIRVDLYNEDPRFFPPADPEVARAIVRDMQRLRSSADRNHQLRLQLGRDSLAIFSRGWRSAGGDEGRLELLQAAWATEKTLLEERLAKFHECVEIATVRAVEYTETYADELKTAIETVESRQLSEAADESDDEEPVRRYRPPDMDAVLRALPQSLRAEEGRMRAAAEQAAADFLMHQRLPSVMRIDWQLLENQLSVRSHGASDAEIQALRDVSAALRRDIQRLVLRAQAAGGGSSVVSDINSRFTAAPTLSASTVQLAQELETVRGNLPPEAGARTALANLVVSSSKFIEVIDRLQDGGDPVWRIVADPANEDNWNKRFARTYFYAEGDAGVVVVRDNPMRFRVHHAENNPAALIQGQLEISRAVTDAALSVAGAAAGFPTESLAAQGDSADTSGIATQSEQLARRRVTAEVTAARRAALLRSLQSSLRVTSTELARLDEDDSKGVLRQRDSLIATLTSLKRILENIDGSE